MTKRFSSTHALPSTITTPGYNRDALKPGILHLGPGAFFRAHLALYTDTAIAEAGGDWGIETGGLRSADFADTLNEQDCLYTVLVREETATRARVVGAVLRGHSPADLLLRLADPAIRIVTLTITEKAYGIDPATGGLDASRPEIAADIANPHAPRSPIGLLVEALALRRHAGTEPFTPLSCDNLPSNGAVLRKLVLALAETRDPVLAEWIADKVSFPSSMVDRITPASTEATYADAARLTGLNDLAAVETEPFSQWVIEDDFPAGRPAWEKAGALMVHHVAPYEKMKLRMLNGTHSLMAYLGVVAGHEFMRDAIADASIAKLAGAHLACAAATLDPVPGVDLTTYTADLMARFANRAIAHRTRQVAMDGTQKLPPRIFEPATEMLDTGGEWQSFAIVTAAWMRYVVDVVHDRSATALNDPREAEIRAQLEGVPRNGTDIAAALLDMPSFVPQRLKDDPSWRNAVSSHLGDMLAGGASPIKS